MNTIISRLLVRRRTAWATAVLAVAGLLAGVYGAQNSNSTLTLKRDDHPGARSSAERSGYADVVKRVSPSVVKITMEAKAKRVRADSDQLPFNDPMLRQFFGNRAPEMRTEPMAGVGSGVIISADGYIVTNNHVVENADTLTVALSDGREFSAKVVGRDPLTDIAVVKVDAKDLPAITIADSTQIEVGDRVLAIGNPFGIGETVTSGIVSALGRRVGILADVQGYENFIQTDAAINPGNSGGALVDLDGRLVGINTAILSHSGGFQGVGLAVPSDMVSQVAGSLVAHGKVVRGYLGVNIQNITPALAESFSLKNREGALVSGVTPDSPAAKAGLKEGDVITAVNGKRVVDSTGLQLAVSALAPDTKLTLEVMRNGQTEHITATTGDRPNSNLVARNDAQDGDDEGVLNGVGVADLDRDARQQMNIPARVVGAVITEVAPDSAAARAGLRAGDVILDINGHKVDNAEQAIALTTKTDSKKTRLRLWSRGATIFVVVDESGTNKSAS
ncbi:MAG TPA: Do family serine endopeptidase [Candidatus Didemnitutus sp.]|nr:Do family serine endopeptidase [Candidatus Didemnitutus sp.]